MKKKDSDSTKKVVRQLQQKPAKSEFLIVGIGASAGGIQALQEFFRQVPVDTGIAYVVILHLSPDHDSQLKEVLQRETQLPVKQVIDKDVIEPDHIYVVSPNKHLTMQDDTIIATTNILMEERRAPVDIFFRTMAEQYGPRAIAVILSGTGANGSMGLKRVKERGGACFVQNPRESEFNEMPRSAIATKMVDEVLSVSKIPQKIISYNKSISEIEITDHADKRPDDQQQALREIFTQLRIRTGHDFTNYKRPTLLRRIERRINITGHSDLSAYAVHMHDNPDEPAALLKDLLISVTNFFRDKKPFEAIELEVLPLLFKDKTSEDNVRIWVPGCATGEEAYSLAILCAEITMGAIDAPKVQIFATDIDEAAVAHAREGLYTLNDTADVSSERLRRFFNKEGDRYRIRREIRETIMFAAHNFLKDPPFSHLDMVSCRNVMIYLNQTAQERVIETFHFALKPGAYLFLGTSESVDGASDLYSVHNRENHIFQRRQVTPRSYPIPETTPSLNFDKFKNDDTSQEQEKKMLDRISFGDLHQQLLEEYAPPSLVVNEDFEILHLTERAGQFLQISGGEPSKNLLKLIKPELRLELRSALYQSAQRQSAVEARGLKVNINDKTETINVKVRPVLRSGDTAKGFILIIFEPGKDETGQEIVLSSDEPLAKQMEEELIRVKIQLRTANEQHDFQAEEMKASNEELQAMNEELRSAAEELETSKEELQSINEELRTVNQELKVKIEETSIASNNLQNIINSTDIGTIFLDRSFRVALYTPAAGSIFNLIPADYGRPLSDITHKLEYHELQRDAETVLEKLNIIEKEVSTANGDVYLMRLTPYRTDEDRINGIIISFINVTERKQTEEALRSVEDKYRLQLEDQVQQRTAELKQSHDQYLTLVQNTPDLITRWDKNLKLIFANSAFENKLGVNVGMQLGKTYPEMGQPENIALPYTESLEKAFSTGKTVEHFNSFSTSEGEVHFYSRITPERNASGEIETILATARDITDLKNATEEIKQKKDELAKQANDRYQELFNSIDEGFCIVHVEFDQNGTAVDYRFVEANIAFATQTGLYNSVGKSIRELSSYDNLQLLDIYGKIAKTLEPERFENLIKETGHYYEVYAFPTGNPEDYNVAVLFNDITPRKKEEEKKELAQEQLRVFEERSRIALESAGMASWDWNVKDDSISWNENHYTLLGLIPGNQTINASFFEKFIHPDDKINVMNSLQQAVETAGEFIAEFRIVRADNRAELWMKGYGRTVSKDNGKASRIIGVMLNITDQREFTDELTRQVKERTLELQRSNDDLRQFAHVASHDLKEPVRKIRTFQNRILEEFGELLPEEVKLYLQRIESAAVRMYTMIDGVLHYSKLGSEEDELEKVDINEIVENIKTDLEVLIDAKKAVITTHNLQSVNAHFTLVYQLFYNLVLNSLKFAKITTPVKIEIVSASIRNETGSYLEITFKDNGIGFRPEQSQIIFNTFTRLHSADKYEGSGLGLALCKKIIERYKGTITAIGEPEKGAIFTLLFPQ